MIPFSTSAQILSADHHLHPSALVEGRVSKAQWSVVVALKSTLAAKTPLAIEWRAQSHR
jgi:hypothetical protein